MPYNPQEHATFDAPNYKGGASTKFYAFGAKDALKEERTQYVLQDHEDNKGRSLETAEGQALCVDYVSKRLKEDPTQCDWFIKDGDGLVRRLEVGFEPVEVPNPTFTELQNKGFNTAEEEAGARKALGTVTVDEIACKERPPTPEEIEHLTEAFPDGLEVFDGPEQSIEPREEVDLANTSFAFSREIEGMDVPKNDEPAVDQAPAPDPDVDPDTGPEL